MKGLPCAGIRIRKKSVAEKEALGFEFKS